MERFYETNKKNSDHFDASIDGATLNATSRVSVCGIALQQYSHPPQLVFLTFSPSTREFKCSHITQTPQLMSTLSISALEEDRHRFIRRTNLYLIKVRLLVTALWTINCRTPPFRHAEKCEPPQVRTCLLLSIRGFVLSAHNNILFLPLKLL
jgi:hypothetical protein